MLCFIILAAFGMGNAQVVTMDFESGDRGLEQGNCWEFPGTTFQTGANAISGVYGGRTGQLTGGVGSPNGVTTPWILFSGSSQIDCKHKMTANNGTWRTLEIVVIDTSLNETVIYTESYSGNFTTLRTVSITETISGINKLYFRFTGQGGNSRGLIDDISVGGQYYSDPTNGCVPLQAGSPDTDGDGVPNDQDDYPSDPDRAYNNYYPSYGPGSLAFEDLWPDKGDYDFNDLVVEYRFQIVTNASNYVVEIFGSFDCRASGAGYRNGFGFNLPSALSGLNNDLVATGMNYSESIITNNANGLETGQTYPTIIVFDNIYSFMGPNGGGFINTVESQAYITPVTINITMTTPGNDYEMDDFGFADFNPFIIVNKERGKEVHLFDYPPTDLANPLYFSTGDDNSNPGLGIYYKTSNNLPWGIEIPQRFDYPIEKEDIINAHLHFGDWAQSGGTTYTDWYEDNPGYRDDSKIYDIP